MNMPGKHNGNIPHPTNYMGGVLKPPQCGNCLPKYTDLVDSPKMTKIFDPDGFICAKCGKILLWYPGPNGSNLLDAPR